MNFNMHVNMKNMIKILPLGLAMFGFHSCEKPDDTPPRSQAFIREYVLPQPTLLSPEEREFVNQEREEYERL